MKEAKETNLIVIKAQSTPEVEKKVEI